MDWGRALAAGLESGLRYEVNNYQSDQDEKKKLEMQQKLNDMNLSNQVKLKAMVDQLAPPAAREMAGVDEQGSPTKTHQTWKLPTLNDKAEVTQPGAWQDESTTPDYQAQHNQALTQQELVNAQLKPAESKSLINMHNAAAAHSYAEADLAKSGKTRSVPEGTVEKFPTGVPGQYTTGVFTNGAWKPYADNQGNVVTGQNWRDREKKGALVEAVDAISNFLGKKTAGTRFGNPQEAMGPPSSSTLLGGQSAQPTKPSLDAPPVPGAKKAPDGKWYVQGGDGKWQMVNQ